MKPGDWATQVLKVLEERPEGAFISEIAVATGLSKPQAKAALDHLRLNPARILVYKDGQVRLAVGPEDAMGVIVRRLRTVANDVGPKLLTLDRLVEKQGISDELEQLCRTAVQITESLTTALLKLDILDQPGGEP